MQPVVPVHRCRHGPTNDGGLAAADAGAARPGQPTSFTSRSRPSSINSRPNSSSREPSKASRAACCTMTSARFGYASTGNCSSTATPQARRQYPPARKRAAELARRSRRGSGARASALCGRFEPQLAFELSGVHCSLVGHSDKRLADAAGPRDMDVGWLDRKKVLASGSRELSACAKLSVDHCEGLLSVRTPRSGLTPRRRAILQTELPPFPETV